MRRLDTRVLLAAAIALTAACSVAPRPVALCTAQSRAAAYAQREIALDGEYVSTVHGDAVLDVVHHCGVTIVFRHDPPVQGLEALIRASIAHLITGDLIPRRVFGRFYGVVKKSPSGWYFELNRVSRLRTFLDCEVLAPLEREKCLVRSRGGS